MQVNLNKMQDLVPNCHSTLPKYLINNVWHDIEIRLLNKLEKLNCKQLFSSEVISSFWTDVPSWNVFTTMICSGEVITVPPNGLSYFSTFLLSIYIPTFVPELKNDKIPRSDMSGEGGRCGVVVLLSNFCSWVQKLQNSKVPYVQGGGGVFTYFPTFVHESNSA